MPAFLSRVLLILLTVASAAAQAQDANADLYDPVAPANSAFVRVLNLSERNIEVTLSGKNKPQVVTSGQFGGYRFVAPGKQRIAVANQAVEHELKANTASTVIYRDGQLLLIADQFVNEPRKAQIAFYNFTDKPAALKTLDGQHVVVDTIQRDQTGSRMVNELKIAFAAYADNQQLIGFDELFLKKGRSYSYALLPAANGYRAITLANSVDPSE
ncbi:alginate O-acetyltransferase AlgF [Ectopseudomonas guguanensis]|jgi:alginate O-acetyltransferase complex protein AlgF|uniref:Alginate biosynthesis protein AlgF n=1 Tax=Ectopseudomonas guguanensis TaxID=1198456 RepID=A0A1H0XAQ9_9GAMM|nr:MULTISPECIES: alginate O-acetyltransferase AlgF [Pseudomonas]MDR8013746.1 alginate O-acetyltransferase AlgF [Pseudomonas guguanensis]MPT18784.1 alginate O-acetyltransferase [Pseudomonas sp.]WJH57758.1 alginate O-acetyltransferase [Pseudomonas guguanensis]SDP99962.1 alginate O-acetyltransferase complex protein AlgF [Pseudomonas guguanensis]